MFIPVSFPGEIPSEESSPHLHPEAEGISGPSSDQEGEEHPVSSCLSLFLSQDSCFLPAFVQMSWKVSGRSKENLGICCSFPAWGGGKVLGRTIHRAQLQLII